MMDRVNGMSWWLYGCVVYIRKRKKKTMSNPSQNVGVERERDTCGWYSFVIKLHVDIF